MKRKRENRDVNTTGKRKKIKKYEKNRHKKAKKTRNKNTKRLMSTRLEIKTEKEEREKEQGYNQTQTIIKSD